jgi:hypothetical protein
VVEDTDLRRQLREHPLGGRVIEGEVIPDGDVVAGRIRNQGIAVAKRATTIRPSKHVDPGQMRLPIECQYERSSEVARRARRAPELGQVALAMMRGQTFFSCRDGQLTGFLLTEGQTQSWSGIARGH